METVLLDRLLRYWLCGLAGGLVHDLLVHRGAVIWPRWDRRQRSLHLGTLAAMLVGVAAAVLADGAPELAFAAAIAGPLVLENAVQITVGRLKGPSEG